MKKLTVGLAVLLSSYAANSFAYLPGGNTSRCDVCVPSYCGGFTFGVTGLYWRASSPQLDFALAFPNSDPVFGFQQTNGNFNSVNHKYDWGFKANIGYVFPCSGNDVNLTYTNWDHDNHRGIGNNFAAILPSETSLFTNTVSIPLLLTTPVVLSSTDDISFSGILSTVSIPFSPTDIIGISARSKFQNQTWDLDFGQAVNVGCNFHLRWFGGLRYTQLKHDLDVTADFAITATAVTADPTSVLFTITRTASSVAQPLPPTAFGTVDPIVDVAAVIQTVVHQHSEFNGVGPRFGVDSSYCLGGGFGVVGSISTSLLVGETESSFSERSSGTGSLTVLPGTTVDIPGVTESGVAELRPPRPRPDPVTITPSTAVPVTLDPNFDLIDFRHPKETRVVPNIDARIGLDWTYQFCNCSRSRVTIEAGYMVSHYFNSIDRLSEAGAIAPDFRTRQTLDVSFDGPYVGVQVNL